MLSESIKVPMMIVAHTFSLDQPVGASRKHRQRMKLHAECCTSARTALVILLVLTRRAGAATSGQMPRAPTFVFEPGVMTINAVSAPLPTGSSTGLNLRFLAYVLDADSVADGGSWNELRTARALERSA